MKVRPASSARALKRYSRRRMGVYKGGGGGGFDGGGGSGCGCSPVFQFCVTLFFCATYIIASYICCEDPSRNCHPDFVVLLAVAILLGVFLIICFWAKDYFKSQKNN